MRAMRVGALVVALLTVAGCAQTKPTSGGPWRSSIDRPSVDQMKNALVVLLKSRPDLAIPEFKISLENSPPVTRDGIVYLGAWNCDPELMTFEACFAGSNPSMFEIDGRFERDNRRVWRAVVRRVVETQKQDLGEFWRASDVEPRRQ